MARTSKSRGASPFTMKSGNKTAFKMMGSTSPIERTDPPTATGWIEADKEYKTAKSGPRENLAERLSARYGTKITKKLDPKTGVRTWSDSKGVSVDALEQKLLSTGEFTYSGE